MARLHRRGLCALLLFLLLAPRPETARAQTPLGPYTDHEVSPSSVTVWADTSGVRLTWYRKDVLRVALLPSRSTTHDSSLVVIREPDPGVSFEVQDTEKALAISSPSLTVEVQKEPVRLQFRTGGTPLLEEPDAAGFVAQGDLRSCLVDG